MSLNRCFKGGECSAGIVPECLWRCIVLGLRTLHAHRHPVHLRPEIVPCLWCLFRTVIDIERQQPAFLLADIYTAFGHLYLFRQLIQPHVVTVQRHLHIAGMVGVWHAQALAHLKHERVHQVGRVAVVGQQHPVLVGVESEDLCLLIEFDAVGFLRIPFPGRVAAPTDTAPSLIVPDRRIRLYLDGTGPIVLLPLACDVHIAIHRDVHPCHTISRGIGLHRRCLWFQFLGVRRLLWCRWGDGDDRL